MLSGHVVAAEGGGVEACDRVVGDVVRLGEVLGVVGIKRRSVYCGWNRESSFAASWKEADGISWQAVTAGLSVR